MSKFRPCIDLHDGVVKQIVGGSLSDNQSSLQTNFVAAHPAGWYADLYRQHNLRGGHVIMLGGGNEQAAREALAAWPQGLQLGGGINAANACGWLELGAEKLIVTSSLFDAGGEFSLAALQQLSSLVGKERLVVDLSCRAVGDSWFVASQRWQYITKLELTHANLQLIAGYCSEFLIHAADVEGLCGGIDRRLVEHLGRWAGLPMTYAGGVASMQDVQLVADLSANSMDVTVGSALDIFGGKLVKFEQLLEFNQTHG